MPDTGGKAVKQYFEGRYYKHQKDDKALSIIVGRTQTKQGQEERFIQVITDKGSFKVPVQKGNYFSDQGIALNINTPQLTLRGAVCYHKLSPIAGDIMGPFRFFPMECRHGIVSMRHRLTGSVVLDGEVLDFTGGLGYMEMNSPGPFPYTPVLR